jgi:hypothetical protein
MKRFVLWDIMLCSPLTCQRNMLLCFPPTSCCFFFYLFFWCTALQLPCNMTVQQKKPLCIKYELQFLSLMFSFYTLNSTIQNLSIYLSHSSYNSICNCSNCILFVCLGHTSITEVCSWRYV